MVLTQRQHTNVYMDMSKLVLLQCGGPKMGAYCHFVRRSEFEVA